jgi:hypothetical protein
VNILKRITLYFSSFILLSFLIWIVGLIIYLFCPYLNDKLFGDESTHKMYILYSFAKSGNSIEDINLFAKKNGINVYEWEPTTCFAKEYTGLPYTSYGIRNGADIVRVSYENGIIDDVTFDPD